MVRVGQISAALGALVFGVLGGATLAQTGLTGLDEHVRVLGIHHTGLLGWIQLVFGVVLLGTAFSWSVSASVAFLGLLSFGFGLVVLITGRAMHGSLGVHAENGWVFVIVGGIMTVAGFLARRASGPSVAGEPQAARHTHDPTP